MSLNIRQGGGSRIKRLIKWMLRRDPDAILIQEWRNNPPGQCLRSTLEACGFCVQVAVRRQRSANGLLTATRHRAPALRVTPSRSPRGELLLGQLATRASVINAYFPVMLEKEGFFRRCIGLAARTRNDPLLLMGDLNSGCNEHDRVEGSMPFGSAPLFHALVGQANLVDVWRHQHGNAHDWSWHSRKNGFRIDHAFANAAFMRRHGPIDCNYDHAPRTKGLTDHSAIIMDCVD